MPSPNAEKNRQYNKTYWNKLSVEERRAKWRERYYNQTPSQRKAHRDRNRRYYRENVHAAQAAAHNASIRSKYSDIYKEGNITNKTLKEWLIKHRDTACTYCNDKNATHIDHIIPLSKGGTHTFDNIQILCPFCNNAKKDLFEEDFFKKIKKIYQFLEK